MQKRDQRTGKRIDALGVLFICLVIAIIVACVIAQIRIFKATGLPRESLPVHARHMPQADQTESLDSSSSHDSQGQNSPFRSELFGYVMLNDGTVVSLCQSEHSSASELEMLTRSTAGFYRFVRQRISDETETSGLPFQHNRMCAPVTFLSEITTSLESGSSQVRWRTPARMAWDETAARKMDLARVFPRVQAGGLTVPGQ